METNPPKQLFRFDGREISARECADTAYCQELGLTYAVILNRRYKGWPDKKIFTTPKTGYPRNGKPRPKRHQLTLDEIDQKIQGMQAFLEAL